jgi:hypothetical protein
MPTQSNILGKPPQTQMLNAGIKWIYPLDSELDLAFDLCHSALSGVSVLVTLNM